MFSFFTNEISVFLWFCISGHKMMFKTLCITIINHPMLPERQKLSFGDSWGIQKCADFVSVLLTLYIGPQSVPELKIIKFHTDLNASGTSKGQHFLLLSFWDFVNHFCGSNFWDSWSFTNVWILFLFGWPFKFALSLSNPHSF